MIGILLLTHADIGHGLIKAVEHILGQAPVNFELFAISYKEPPEALQAGIQENLKRVDAGDGVLILSDIYGASHTNAACKLLHAEKVELITGINLPMLIRALNYRHLPMPELLKKAMAGGCEGIYHPQLQNKNNKANA